MANRIIAVIGMHRSGTSAMTRALGYAGASLGDDFIETMPEVNAKGFWEDATLNAINIEVLRRLGMDWLSNRAVPAERFDEEDFRLIAENAVAILMEKTSGAGVFAFKDPRTSILLPFWQQVFARAGTEAAYLIAVRHPASVADSLHARNGFERVKSEMLWLRHTVESIVRTVGARRVLVDFDSLMDHPIEELRRIASALCLKTPTAEAEAEFARRFLAPELRHSRHHADDTELAPSGSLYAALRKSLTAGGDLDDPAIAMQLGAASRFLKDAEPMLGYLDQLEYTVATAMTKSELPCLPTLRASFGIPVEEAAPETASSVTRKHWLSRLVNRLR